MTPSRKPVGDDRRRFILADKVTGARIYAGEYPEDEAKRLAERLAPGYKYELVRVGDYWEPPR